MSEQLPLMAPDPGDPDSRVFQSQPLAARMRPDTLEEFAGQKHLIGEGKVLRRLIASDTISSMIFWGPPGVGKTTLAQIIARQTKANFINFSAVTSGIKEIRQVMTQAEENRIYGVRTIVFVDEIHRFNKAQQDAFLPFVEKGSIILIGATTENPSFEVNSALLSRCKVFVLQALTREDILWLLRRALSDPRGFGRDHVSIPDRGLEAIADFCNGDARSALSTLEMVVLNGDVSEQGITVSEETLAQCLSRKSLMYDKDGEEHYNLISALHKSMRNSDPDAAVYWRIPCISPGGCSASPRRMSAWRIPGPWRWVLLPIRPVISSGFRNATSIWRKPWSICPSPASPTPWRWPPWKQRKQFRRNRMRRSPCISGMRPPGS